MAYSQSYTRPLGEAGTLATGTLRTHSAIPTGAFCAVCNQPLRALQRTQCTGCSALVCQKHSKGQNCLPCQLTLIEKQLEQKEEFDLVAEKAKIRDELRLQLDAQRREADKDKEQMERAISSLKEKETKLRNDLEQRKKEEAAAALNMQNLIEKVQALETSDTERLALKEQYTELAKKAEQAENDKRSLEEDHRRVCEEKASLTIAAEQLWRDEEKRKREREVGSEETKMILRGKSSFYDIIIDVDEFSGLIRGGWPILGRNANEITSWKGTVVATVGDFNKGKTHILSRLVGLEQLPTGREFHTRGLSFKRIAAFKGTPYIALDTAGGNSPVEETTQEKLAEKKVEEEFLRRISFEMADVLIYVVNELNAKEQLEIFQISHDISMGASQERRGRDFRRLVVIHNRMDIRTKEDYDLALTRLEEMFGQASVREVTVPAGALGVQEPYERGFRYIIGEETRCLFQQYQQHYLLGHDGTPGGELNPWVYAAISQDLQAAHAPAKHNLIEDLRRCSSQLLLRYIEPTQDAGDVGDPCMCIEDRGRYQVLRVDSSKRVEGSKPEERFNPSRVPVLLSGDFDSAHFLIKEAKKFLEREGCDVWLCPDHDKATPSEQFDHVLEKVDLFLVVLTPGWLQLAEGINEITVALSRATARNARVEPGSHDEAPVSKVSGRNLAIASICTADAAAKLDSPEGTTAANELLQKHWKRILNETDETIRNALRAALTDLVQEVLPKIAEKRAKLAGQASIRPTSYKLRLPSDIGRYAVSIATPTTFSEEQLARCDSFCDQQGGVHILLELPGTQCPKAEWGEWQNEVRLLHVTCDRNKDSEEVYLRQDQLFDLRSSLAVRTWTPFKRTFYVPAKTAGENSMIIQPSEDEWKQCRGIFHIELRNPQSFVIKVFSAINDRELMGIPSGTAASVLHEIAKRIPEHKQPFFAYYRAPRQGTMVPQFFQYSEDKMHIGYEVVISSAPPKEGDDKKWSKIARQGDEIIIEWQQLDDF